MPLCHPMKKEEIGEVGLVREVNLREAVVQVPGSHVSTVGFVDITKMPVTIPRSQLLNSKGFEMEPDTKENNANMSWVIDAGEDELQIPDSRVTGATQWSHGTLGPPGVAGGRKDGSKNKGVVALINWMKGQKSFTIQDDLHGPTPSLQITLPQLLDCSRRLQQDLAELLRSSITHVRKKKSSPITGPSAAIHTSKLVSGYEVVSEAEPAHEGNTECLYTEAWIGRERIPDVLVDAGAMLDLISTQLVEKLQLRRFPVSGLRMRVADTHLVVLKYYVWIDVVVAGVLSRIKAYEVAVSQTYQLLRSRRWLKRVHEVEHHDSHILFIEGSDHVRRKVAGLPMESSKDKMETVELESTLDVDDEEAEEAIETLLNELDI
ncbi:hypothetical protein HOY82DRAFT_602670 [Tuber indicum]|nr:hypothetical protein HOY82DRAFT_602670 [Tuber indicum]